VGSSPTDTVPFSTSRVTDIVIDCISDAADHTITTAMQMNVELLGNAAHDGKVLLFKKISSGEWKCDQIVEL
jgi:hypothetical protein